MPARGRVRGALIVLAGCTLGASCAPSSPRLDTGAAPLLLTGHQELDASAAGGPLPRMIGGAEDARLCLTAAAAADTSRWEGRVLVDPPALTSRDDAGFAPPTARLGTTLCFALPPLDALSPGMRDACLDVVDRFDGARARAGCVPFRLASDDGERDALLAEVGPLIARRSELPVEEFVARLDELRGRAARSDLPFLRLRLTLVGAYVLRRAGTAAALAAAAERLDEAPPWIDAPAATGWAAQLAYERATLALATDWDLRRAWSRLTEAQAAYRLVADPSRVVASLKQAEILARVGAAGEGRDRLRAALDECAAAPCRESLMPAARGTLAWLIVLDPDATDAELRDAETILAAALDALRDDGDPLERANAAINLAYVRLRLGAPHDAELRLAGEWLAGTPAESARARDLAGWVDLVAALAALRDGRPADALALGRRIAATAAAPRLRAWGVGCQARAYRRLGALDAAAETMERALLLHEYATAARLGQDVPLGPGQRADDVYAAARIEIERGRPEDAWSLLASLDTADARTACVAAGDLAWAAERDEILDRLATLESPASGDLRRHRRAIREELLRRLQELVRRHAPCPAAERPVVPAEYRAFALDDEVVLLRRGPDGSVSAYRRTPLDRRRVRALAADLRRALDSRDEDGDAWTAAAAALAPALVPAPGELGPVTTFAVHGVLQDVPLAALPAGDATLGERTLVVLRPAAGGARDVALTGRPPLFVVDPGGDLPAGPTLARRYGELFPDATVLATRRATRSALEDALPRAGWLHVDAHVAYDPAFPELSRVELADGPLTADRLAAAGGSLAFANLSACRSGSWPTTADSGRYGLAGWLSRQGVPWVVAARAALDDRLAAEFNTELYERLADGVPVDEALRAALDRVRRGHPPWRWGALVVLHGGPGNSGGQTAGARTPTLMPGFLADGPPPARWGAR